MTTKLAAVLADDRNKCVEVSFATMRAALGYSTPLPKRWATKTRNCVDIVHELHKVFPRHDISVWCTYADFMKAKARPSIIYMGTNVPAAAGKGRLLCFVYGEDGDPTYHMVVGWPYKPTPTGILPLVIGVCSRPESKTIYDIASTYGGILALMNWGIL